MITQRFGAGGEASEAYRHVLSLTDVKMQKGIFTPGHKVIRQDCVQETDNDRVICKCDDAPVVMMAKAGVGV